MEKTLMTGSHRSVLVRALTRSTRISAIWIADTRCARAENGSLPSWDSITGSPGCWRVWLWHGPGSDLAGALPPQGCGLPGVVMLHLDNTCAVTCAATAGGVTSP